LSKLNGVRRKIKLDSCVEQEHRDWSKQVDGSGNMSSESYYDRSPDLPCELLKGAIDSHVHAGPALKSNPSYPDPFQVAEEARDAGMRAIVYYDVFGNSAGTSWLVSRKTGGIDLFGGLILSTCQGGLNPRAVKSALFYGSGARFISFGAHSTRYQASQESRLVDGELVPIAEVYPAFAEKELPNTIAIPLKEPVPWQLQDILKMVADRPEVYLNTGHVSKAEALRVIELADRFGIKKVLLAHPTRSLFSIEEQRELGSAGVFLEGALADWLYPAVPRTHYYVEKEYIDESALLPSIQKGAVDWMNTIREVGPEFFVLCTDYGVRAAAPSVQGMRTLIATLLDMEFPVDEIRSMTSMNPSRLIGIEAR